MIKHVYIKRITIERTALARDAPPDYPKEVLAVEADYIFQDENRNPVGASGTYKYIPPDAREATRTLIQSIEDAIREDLLGELSSAEAHIEKKRLVPISKEDL